MTVLWAGACCLLVALTAGQKSDLLYQVAFSAGLSHHVTLPVGNTVKYDHVFTNIDNAYDPTTGEFTCPQTGIYVFQYHSLSRSNETLWVSLYQDYMYVNTAYAHTTNDFAAAGNDAVLHLTRGDHVSIQSEGDDGVSLYGAPDEIYCTFSGYLISPIIEETPVIDAATEVAFSAGLSHHQSLTGGQTVVYNRIITNVGNAYNPATGVFTCPISGAYVFQYHAMSRQDSTLYLELYLNDKYISSAYGHTITDYASGSNSGILELNKGDAVSVKAAAGYQTDLYGQVYEVYSTFSAAQDVSQFETAFSAGLTTHLTLQAGATVIYDKVFTNIGNAYDNKTGVFTCPQTGIYVFQYHGLSMSDDTLWLELYHNYNYVSSAYAHTDSDFASAGNSVILHLFKGDTVMVNAEQDQESNLYGVSDEVYCTFSGYLIAPVFEESVVVG
ncbi:complement C1q tumor necrosis factor-related protein 4-like [Haliotis rufescens]|uniref:complement C1q tumor necrosis factor-related protein 4-like n=1 Tax=Haliotis rufescens TaxID=6454 RepID=UPI00201EB2EC|nr:complement C1q tumor necrosis factor-related protein 4-like [Haliotis rufescens]